MSSMEEKLWEYIDGSATPDEQQAINLLIEQDEAYRAKYLELLKLDQEFAAIELDEPPMAFAYNVMEAIRTEQAQKPLKATVNNTLIKIIAGFFMGTILLLVVYLLANIKWTTGNTNTPLINFQLPDLTGYLKSPFIKGFIYFDIVLGLYFFDRYLRKNSFAK